MFSPQFRSRLLLLSGIALALGVIVATSKLFHVPAHREFGGSLLHEPSPIVAFVVVGTALVGCVLLCTLVAGRVRFDAGLFCATVGAVALTARSGTVGDVLRARAAAGGGATVFVTFAAELVLLYALLFAMPLTGWMMSSARNFPVSWFKLFQFPDLVAPAEQTVHRMNDLHHLLFSALVTVALLHIAGALKHHFIDRNDVLKRMLPFGRVK